MRGAPSARDPETVSKQRNFTGWPPAQSNDRDLEEAGSIRWGYSGG